jgi:hypothetical protein
MQSNFEKMTTQELITYALEHREEIEPLRILYSRRTPDEAAIWYEPMSNHDGLPIEENIRLAQEAIQQRIQLPNQP